MKQNYFLQIILSIVIGVIYFITLYTNNWLNDYCFNFDDCRVIIIYNFFKLLILFGGVNLIWLFKLPRFKTIIILIANTILFSFFITGNDAFMCTPFIFSLILFDIFYVSKFEKNIKLLIFENLLLFILLTLLYLSLDELILGLPFSQQELYESSIFFQNYLLISALFVIALTLFIYLFRFKTHFKN